MSATDLPGASQVQDANNQGQSAINQFDPTQVANTRINSTNQLVGSQTGGGPSNENQYMQAYAGQVAANPDVRNLYNQANEQFGVPQLAQRANQLNTMVTNETPNAYNLMRGFDASDAQVQNKIGTDLRFLNPQATAATNASQTAQNLAGQQVGYGITQNQMNLLPIQQYGQMLNQTLAAQATGWNSANQDLYNGLQAKMQSGVQLSQTEMQQMASLTAAKEQYDAAIAGQQAAIQQTKLGSNILVPGGNVLYNPYANNGQGATFNPFKV